MAAGKCRTLQTGPVRFAAPPSRCPFWKYTKPRKHHTLPTMQDRQSHCGCAHPRALPLTLPAAPERQRRLTPCGCSNRRPPTTSGDRSPVLPGFLRRTQRPFERRSIRVFGGFADERGANRAATASVHSYSPAQKLPAAFWAVLAG